MRLTKIFNSASAAVLLFGTTLGTRTPGTSGDQANHKFKNKERKEVTNTHDADAAKIHNIRTGRGTAATPPPPVASVSAASVLVGVHENTIEASLGVHGVFATLSHLITGTTIWKPSSGTDTSTTTRLTTMKEVSTDLAGDFHHAHDDTQDEEFRWTRFDHGAPPPMDQFVDRFFNALLYVAHVINAEHIRALLYGRKRGRYRIRRRYRITNPNSRRHRRLRRIWRVTADLDRMLLGAWTQIISTTSSFFGGEPEAGVEVGPSPCIKNTAAVPVPPPPSVPVAHWPPVPDSSDILHHASLLAVLTPLETPPAPWLPLSSLPPAAALRDAIPLENLPAAPLFAPALSVAPLRQEPTATRAIVPYQAPADPWRGLNSFPPASVLRAAIPLEQLLAGPFIAPSLPVSLLRREPTTTRAIVPYQAPSNLWAGLNPAPPAAAVRAAIPLEQLPAGPLFIPGLPVMPLRQEPVATRAIVPYQAPSNLWAGLNPAPPAAAVRAVIPLEQLPAGPLFIRGLPVMPILQEPTATRAVVPYQEPSNLWAGLNPVPPASVVGAAILLEQLPAGPLFARDLPIAQLGQEPNATRDIVPYQAPSNRWAGLNPVPPVSVVGAAILLELLPAGPLFAPALPIGPLRQEPVATRAIVPYQAPSNLWAGLNPAPPAAAVRAVIPLEQLPVGPLFAPGLPIAPLRQEPTTTRAIVPYQAPSNLRAGLNPVPPASVVGAANPLEQLPAGPFIAPALLVAPLRQEPTATRAGVPYQAPSNLWAGLNPVPPASVVGAVILLEQLPAGPLIAPGLPIGPLRQEPVETRAIVPYQAPSNLWAGLNPAPPAAAVRAVIPLEQLPAGPLFAPFLRIAPLRQEPTATREIVPYQDPSNLWAGLNPVPPASVVGAAILLEQLPAGPFIAPALLVAPLCWEPDVAWAIVSYHLPADPWRGLNLVPPAAAAQAVIALEQLPAAPLISRGLPVAPLRRKPTATRAIIPLDVVDPVDAVDWSSVAKTFAVMDLDESDGMTIPTGGWRHAIKADVELLSVEACPLERSAVRWILTEAVELYPFTGYARGSEHAALAIYRGIQGDKEAALKVFVHWASPAAWLQRSTVAGQAVLLEEGMRHSWKVLRKQSPTAHTWLEDETMDALYAEIFLSAVSSICVCQGLPRDIVHCLVQKTLEAGNNGPAVSLWVMHSLLAASELDCKTKMDATPDICIRTRLQSAGKTMTSFEDLERHAPMALSSFVTGYAAAVFGKVRLF